MPTYAQPAPPPPGRRETSLPTRSGVLEKIRTGQAINKPLRFLLFAGPGWGKTTLAVQAPEPFLIMSTGENSYETLLAQGRVPEIPRVEVETWSETMEVLRYLETKEHKTIVIDTASGVQGLCFDAVCRDHFSGDLSAFESYGAGYRVATKYWAEFLSVLERLNKAKMIFVLAHQETSTFHDPRGHETSKYQASLSTRLWQITERWPDNVLFGSELPIEVKKDKRTTLATGPKVIYTSRGPIHDAKNKHGLPELITLPDDYRLMWSTLWDAIEATRTDPEEISQ